MLGQNHRVDYTCRLLASVHETGIRRLTFWPNSLGIMIAVGLSPTPQRFSFRPRPRNIGLCNSTLIGPNSDNGSNRGQKPKPLLITDHPDRRGRLAAGMRLMSQLGPRRAAPGQAVGPRRAEVRPIFRIAECRP